MSYEQNFFLLDFKCPQSCLIFLIMSKWECSGGIWHTQIFNILRVNMLCVKKVCQVFSKILKLATDQPGIHNFLLTVCQLYILSKKLERQACRQCTIYILHIASQLGKNQDDQQVIYSNILDQDPYSCWVQLYATHSISFYLLGPYFSIFSI